MAVTVLAPQDTNTLAGLTPVYTAANTDGHSITNNGQVILHVKNTNAATRTVTVDTPGTSGGNAIANPAYVIPATTGDMMLGPFPPGFYNQTDGTLLVTFSAVTNLTIAAIRLP